MMQKKELLARKTEDEMIGLYQKKWRTAWVYGAGALISTLMLSIFTSLLSVNLQKDFTAIMTSPIWNGMSCVAIGLSVVDVICMILALCHKLSADKILRKLRDSTLAELHNSKQKRQ